MGEFGSGAAWEDCHEKGETRYRPSEEAGSLELEWAVDGTLDVDIRPVAED